jgi:dihydroorotate dehydrogenase
MIAPLIISAPLGNYLSFAGCTSTLGTFTLRRRGGPFYRLWRCAWTLRYSWRLRGWINKLGLPNPGIDSLAGRDLSDVIVSVHGLDAGEWAALGAAVLSMRRFPLGVELNLSCPNVTDGRDAFAAAVRVASFLVDGGVRVIAKLPPVRWMEPGDPLYDAGVRTFHLCNTIPTAAGGLSGKTLKQYSLWAIECFRQSFGDAVTLIGGGGVTCEQDVLDYRSAGADHVAVASMLLNPFNWRKVPRLLEATAGGGKS